jgi:deferrochelatase/peroxidase EfeB
VTPISRRRFLGVAGVAAGGIAVGGVTGGAVATAVNHDDTANRGASSSVVPFYGAHQAGIATAAQDRLLFASFDVTTERRSDVEDLLRAWTDAAARLTQGDPVGAPMASRIAPPTDTGEAAGLYPARLTLTFGLGPSLFVADGVDRFGLAHRRPAPLLDLPAFPHDELDQARSGGDLCVQACGDDPQVLFHAIRNLTRIGRGTVVLRWAQEGFGRTSSTTTDQSTPRNLMGFKDGTNNLRAGTRLFDDNVWAAAIDDPAWMRGGSYMVTRRIRIRIETWDRSSLDDQEKTIGRRRTTGAAFGQASEFDPVDPKKVPEDSHIALSNQDANRIHILRRGYNFTDGIDPRMGQLDAGLFFIAYQRDPGLQFIPLQRKLAAHDALNEYIVHVGSGIFAVPPGVTKGGWIGQHLFA